MKTKVLLVSLFAAFSLNAQVEIHEFINGQEVGNDLCGDQITLNVTTDETHYVKLSIKNISGADQEYVIERLRIEEVAGWEDGLCWGPRPDDFFVGKCYLAAQMSTNPWTTPSWNTGTPNYTPVPMGDQSYATLVIDIATQGPGCGHYRYFVKEGNTNIDSVDVVVCSSVSIEKAEGISFSVAPNPTSDIVTLGLPSNDGNYDVRVYDVKGAKVNLPSMVNNTLNFSSVLNGVYSIVITDQQGNSARRQIIVNH